MNNGNAVQSKRMIKLQIVDSAKLRLAAWQSYPSSNGLDP